jgi:hypothetical protein
MKTLKIEIKRRTKGCHILQLFKNDRLIKEDFDLNILKSIAKEHIEKWYNPN